jgi:hypothetical protein
MLLGMQLSVRHSLPLTWRSPTRRLLALPKVMGRFSAVGLTALLALALVAGPAAAAPVTATSVLKVAKTAIGTQTSVHVDFAATSKKSKVTERITADVGATGGAELVTEGKSTLAIKVTPTAGYVSGNATGLTQLYGLTAAQAKKLGTHWVTFKATTSQYATLKSDVSFSSVLALLPKPKGTKVKTRTANGTTQYVLSWTTAASSSNPKLSNSLTVAAGGTNLPLEETETDSTGVKVTTTLSKWGESVRVGAPAPASTIDSSQITG